MVSVNDGISASPWYLRSVFWLANGSAVLFVGLIVSTQLESGNSMQWIENALINSFLIGFAFAAFTTRHTMSRIVLGIISVESSWLSFYDSIDIPRENPLLLWISCRSREYRPGFVQPSCFACSQG